VVESINRESGVPAAYETLALSHRTGFLRNTTVLGYWLVLFQLHRNQPHGTITTAFCEEAN